MSWLYVPGSEALNSESNSQIQNQNAFVMSRGKLMPPQSLSNAWKKKSWIRHLSGLMLKPSMASRGVAKWIASLEDTHANHSPVREPEKAKTTRDICGRTSHESSETCNQDAASLKTSLATYRWDLKPSQMTCKEWATRLRLACSLRKKLVALTKERDSSLWPTPNVPNGGRVMKTKDVVNKGATSNGKRQVPLEMVARLWASGYFHQPHQIKMDGDSFLNSNLRLNPQFTELLMGWTKGWTGFEHVEMEWSRWLWLMRGEFSVIALVWDQTLGVLPK